MTHIRKVLMMYVFSPDSIKVRRGSTIITSRDCWFLEISIDLRKFVKKSCKKINYILENKLENSLVHTYFSGG